MTRGVLQRPDGARVPYELHGDGDGPRLVFGHGLTARGLGAGALFQPLLDAGWRVLCLDHRGHGEASPLLDGAFPLRALGDDMLALLDHAGWDRAWFGGGSMGAAIAMAAAAAAPERVEGLVLMAPAVGVSPNPALQRFAGLGEVFARGGLDAGIEAQAATARAAGAGDDAVAWRSALLRMQPAQSWAAVLRGIAGWDVRAALDVLQALDVPALVITWQGDDVHPLAVAEDFAARLRDARLHVITEWAGDPAQLFRIMAAMAAELGAARPHTPAPVLLDSGTVLDHLRARGVLRPGEPATARQLGGGVSNTVLAVDAGSRRLVVKQALPRLRVAREWLADPARTCTEGRALRVAAGIDASAVPPVVDLDESANVLVIAAAPEGTTDWKQRLLHGDISGADVDVARRTGALLGRLHAGTAQDGAVLARFDCWDAFEQLRVAPYFHSMVADSPALAGAVLPHVEAMVRRRVCLVHGDVSPKNLLVGDGLLWLIDFEVACCGDPAFDVAFMLTHLTLKAVHRPAHAATLHAAQGAFVAAYREIAGGLLDDEAHVAGLLGCLLMARVDGRSPAEYLSGTARRHVRAIGLDLATAPPPTVDAALRHTTAVAR